MNKIITNIFYVKCKVGFVVGIGIQPSLYYLSNTNMYSPTHQNIGLSDENWWWYNNISTLLLCKIVGLSSNNTYQKIKFTKTQRLRDERLSFCNIAYFRHTNQPIQMTYESTHTDDLKTHKKRMYFLNIENEYTGVIFICSLWICSLLIVWRLPNFSNQTM